MTAAVHQYAGALNAASEAANRLLVTNEAIMEQLQPNEDDDKDDEAELDLPPQSSAPQSVLILQAEIAHLKEEITTALATTKTTEERRRRRSMDAHEAQDEATIVKLANDKLQNVWNREMPCWDNFECAELLAGW